MSYATSNYLIYSCFETKSESGSIIAGSLLLDHALTEEEVDEKIAIYKERGSLRLVFIKNRQEWWHL